MKKDRGEQYCKGVMKNKNYRSHTILGEYSFAIIFHQGGNTAIHRNTAAPCTSCISISVQGFNQELNK